MEKKEKDKENDDGDILYGVSDDNKKDEDEILPEYDEDRVYVSDMKKVIQWYNLLHRKGIVNFDAAVNSEEE